MGRFRQSYLYNAVSPALTHPVSSPHVVSILSESLDQCVLVRGQFNVVQVQRSGFVTVALCISTFKSYNIKLEHSVWVTILHFSVMNTKMFKLK